MNHQLHEKYYNGLINRLYVILCFFEQDISTRNDFLLNVEHEVIGASDKTGISDFIRLSNKLAYIRLTFGNESGKFVSGSLRHKLLRKEIMSCIRIVEGIKGGANDD